MLSLKKSSSEKTAGSGSSAWHPNFRNFERLPDTKVVRTSFFINGMAVLVATALTIYVGYREFGLRTLASDVEGAQSIVDENKSASDQAVALYGKFQAEEKKVAALRDFLAPAKFVVSDLILKFGANLPPFINLNSIEYKPTSVVLTGGIEGAADEASGRAAAYVDALRISPDFKELFETVTLSTIARDPGSGLIRFEIEMKIKPATPPVKGAKK
jgi:hypothetical protein